MTTAAPANLPNISETLTRMDDTIDILDAVGFMLFATMCSKEVPTDYMANGIQRLIDRQCAALRSNRDAISEAYHESRASKLEIRNIHEVARVCRVPVELAERIVFMATGISFRKAGKLMEDTGHA